MNGDEPIAVFDTNVLVSGFLNPHGAPGQIVDWLRSGVVHAGLDDRIVSEYEDVLYRPRLDLPRHEVHIVLRQIQFGGKWAAAEPRHVAHGLPDPDDAPFAECAAALGCCLVTGNKRHFPRAAVGKLRVLSPRQFRDAISEP
ncbi:MAG: PIN domain-containing protein [Verrucomicrobia bacterium]|nr:PIN domain-containing protein [Verrucomicrobiota bacterium]